jgi:hypothetical protein
LRNFEDRVLENSARPGYLRVTVPSGHAPSSRTACGTATGCDGGWKIAIFLDVS